MTDIALQLDVLQARRRLRPRSDSQSHHTVAEPPQRMPAVYFVTLSSLNDTFVKKHLLVPYYPDTRKLGRPAGAKIKPDSTNGYFDLRVLSRSHAAMYMDAGGKLMIKDLGLSNGTYVNDERIGADPVEIKIGDTIFLGFNIQADTNHKQISARVDNISVMSNFVSSSVPEVGQYNYVQSVLDRLRDPSAVAQSDLALFADMVAGLTGLNTASGPGSGSGGSQPSEAFQENVGMYKNANLVTSPSVVAATRTLAATTARLQQHNNALLSVEQFLSRYKSLVDAITARKVEQKVAAEVTLVVAEKIRRAEQAATKERQRERQLYENLIEEFEQFRDEKEAKVRDLEAQLAEIRSPPATDSLAMRELTPDSESDHKNSPPDPGMVSILENGPNSSTSSNSVNDVDILSILAPGPEESQTPKTATDTQMRPYTQYSLTLGIVALLVGMALQRALHA